jgi:hypothetical protein
MNELHALVDTLALDLGRPVGLDDRHFRALAYSSHDDAADAVRRASILRRQAPPKVTEWLSTLGLAAARDPVRVPARPELGMAARVCVPVVFREVPLGYLWLIDEPDPLDDGQLRASRRCATALGEELFRDRLRDLDEREREQRLVRALVSSDDSHGHDVAGIAPAVAYAVVLLRAVHERDRPGETVEVRLAAGVEQVRRRVAPHTVLGAVEGGDAVVVLAVDGVDAPAMRATLLQQAAAEHLADRPGWTVVAGVGGVRPSLEGGLRRSYEQARDAADLSSRIETLGAIVVWDDLGAYRVISALVAGRPPLDFVPAALGALLSTPNGRGLAETLEVYLEHAGDARSTAEALFVHRSSLYGRLHRIEAVTGADLSSGDTRLELQLWLRLWRMAGAATPPPPFPVVPAT